MTTDAEAAGAVAAGPKVPFLDLRVIDPDLREEMLAAVAAVLDHGRVVLGPEVDTFEERLAAYCGTRFAIGVASGSAALQLALQAAGIGPGDEVVTTTLSFVATAHAISLVGARPVFADVRPDLTVDPAAVEAAVTERTRAIMPVHFTGKLCDMDALAEIAERRGLVVIEDAAPAIGASLRGRKAGSFGVAGCLSINPMKILKGVGEAGAVLTDDPSLAETLTALRYNGMLDRERSAFVSSNARLDTLQAALLLPRLARLEDVIARRRAIAAFYSAELGDVVQVPAESAGARDVYYTYTIQTDRRDELGAHLAGAGVESRVQHPLLMPEQPMYGEPAGRYPVAARAAGRVLCIPANETLDDAQVELVASAVRSFFAA